ncbi:hypothetical protein [Mangrovihabitans endophyticus]|nr:hypothetical protein [Mangrovihabitans endophyticus]
MSYDMPVWEGDRPANDAAAVAEFEALYARFVESEDQCRMCTPLLRRR